MQIHRMFTLSSLLLVGIGVAVWACPSSPGIQAAPAASTILSSLKGLPFDAFLEAASRQALLRSPQTLTMLGLSARLGLKEDQLDDLSDAFQLETQRLEKGLQELLRSYDRNRLSREQQLSADVLDTYLTDQIRGHAFRYHTYLISPLEHASYHTTTIRFFTDLHPIRNLAEARGYVHRLSGLGTQIDQVIDGLKRREAAGVLLPKFYFAPILTDLGRFYWLETSENPLYKTLQTKLQALPQVTEAGKQSLLTEARSAIEESVKPGLKRLIKILEAQEPKANAAFGAKNLPQSEAFYAWKLKQNTTTDLSAAEIHQLGLAAVARIQGEIREACKALGYPAGENLQESIDRAERDNGVIQDVAIKQEYERLIQASEKRITSAFGLFPKAKVTVVGGPTGGFYIPAAMDGSRPGAFYAATLGRQATYMMPTLAYHEAVPGHHTQLAIAQEQNLPLFRQILPFNAYNEGWALYAERLAWELGAYTDNPLGNIGRLKAELYRAARLVVDTGINAKGWTREASISYLMEQGCMDRESADYETARYACDPAQAVSYMVGMTRILALRQHMKERLGTSYDLKAFHDLVLRQGALPLNLLEKVVEEEVARRTTASPAKPATHQP